jgi:hypothetical protein
MGAITFILENPRTVESYLADQERLWNELETNYPLPPDMRSRFEEGRELVEAAAGLKLRFQADADFKNSAVLAVARRWPFIDIRSAQRIVPDAFPDPDMLAFAASEERVLLTHDVTTMPAHFRRFIEEHESPGIILVRTGPLDPIDHGRRLFGMVPVDTRRSSELDAMAATLTLQPRASRGCFSSSASMFAHSLKPSKNHLVFKTLGLRPFRIPDPALVV